MKVREIRTTKIERNTKTTHPMLHIISKIEDQANEIKQIATVRAGVIGVVKNGKVIIP